MSQIKERGAWTTYCAWSVQINTGRGFHLDADMVARVHAELQPGEGGLLFIENVGNLVCPAAFELARARGSFFLSPKVMTSPSKPQTCLPLPMS